MNRQGTKKQQNKKVQKSASKVSTLRDFLAKKPESRTTLKSGEVKQVGKFTAKFSASQR